jgi:hypothetical protein
MGRLVTNITFLPRSQVSGPLTLGISSLAGYSWGASLGRQSTGRARDKIGDGDVFTLPDV